MELNDKPGHPHAELPRKYGVLLLGWSLLVGGSVLWDRHQESQHTLQNAAAAARANISKDLLFRRWATSHGGVYVPPNEHTPPNPYLKVPDRDVVTTTGKKLTLMNPAYMLRELQENFPDEYGTRSHITSLKLLNPRNAPDAWEKQALQGFERGEKERLEMQQIDGQPYLRLMRPLIAEPGCLKCHGFQGYKAGDIRGGLSTSVAMAPYLARESELIASQELTHGTIWLIGLAGLAFSYRRERKLSGERRKTEQEVAMLNSQTRLILDSAGEGIYGLDIDGRCTFANPAASKLLGYTVEELVGRHTHALFHHTKPDGSHYPPEDCPVHAAFRQGEVRRGRDLYWRKDGSSFPVEFVSTPTREAGKVTGAVVTFSDITERRRTEEELHAASLYSRSLIEASLDPLVTISPEGKITDVNAATEKATGRKRTELIGTDFSDYFTEPGKAQAGYRRVFQYGSVTDYPLALRHRDGHITDVLYNASVYRDEAGEVLGVFAAARDVTAQKQASQYARSLIEASLDPLVTISIEGKITDVNAATEKATGRSRPELIGTDFSDYFTEPGKAQAGYQRVFQYGSVTDYPLALRHRDGHITDVLYNASVYRDETGKVQGVFAAARDITERKQAEDALREKEERIALATLHNGVGIWDWNLVTQEMIWDDSMYALYHIRREDFSGTEEAWRKSLHPDDLERGDREVADAISGRKPFDTEFRVVWPGGEIRHIKAVAKVFRDDQGKPLRMLGTNMDITDRKQAETRLRELNNDFVTLLENTGDFIYFKDQDSRFVFCSQTLADITGHRDWREMVGKHDAEVFPADTARIYYEEELPIFREGRPLLNKTDPYYDEQGRRRWVDTNKWPVFGDDGKTVVGIFGISRDITELKEAEDRINELNRDLEHRVAERTEQLEAANKELEAFSYSVSHDLRTPLRAIDGFSRILLEDYADKLDDEGRRLLNVVRDNTGRMNQLIDDILKFSRSGRVEINFSEIDMGRLAQEVFEELRPSFAGSEPRLEIGHLPPAMGDRALMHQVFVNLLSNAAKFSRSRETPTIRVGCSIEGGDNVYFVQDNGAGFDMQYADRLFGVFQRLHGMNEFEGTGIGLAIVKRIVNRHGGRVWAEGKVDEGATIYFSIPNRS